jgi:hypothetical protein
VVYPLELEILESTSRTHVDIVDNSFSSFKAGAMGVVINYKNMSGPGAYQSPSFELDRRGAWDLRRRTEIIPTS